jgi:hypothetical protein
MFTMSTARRLTVAFAAGFTLLLPSPVSAESGTTTPTLPPTPTVTVPTVTVPQLQVPSLAPASSTGGSLTVPTITVPTIAVPQLQVPSLTVPQLQAPEMPAITAPQGLEVASTPETSAPSRTGRASRGATTSPAAAPQTYGLIAPEVLLEMIKDAQSDQVAELVPPQEATTSTNRLPIGTFAAFGGGATLIGFAVSLLRRRAETRPSAE